MPQYLDPKNDLTFKRVFGEHKHLCMSLINSMLPLDYPVVSIEYQTGELIPELVDVLRNTIVDVRCTDSEGRQFLVEMQLNWSEVFKSRVLLNASKAFVLQLDKAQDIELLKPVYSLNFVNKTFEKDQDMENEYLHHYKIVNIKHTNKQIKGLEFLFVELPKFKPLNRAEKKLHELWLRFLTEVDENTEIIPDDLLENELIREAVRHMEKAAYTKEQLKAYDKFKIDSLTAAAMLNEAEKKGKEQGIELGKEQGIEIGKEQGEKINQMKTIENGVKKGYAIEIIADITGLTTTEIIKIIEEIKETNSS